MKYLIEKGKGASYLQLYKYLRNDIITGSFGYHAKLPSKRILAEETGTSIVTVEHAYALLCDEGYAEARQRSGYFVVFRPGDGFAAAQEGKEEKEHIPAAVVQPAVFQSAPSFPYSILCRTMRKVLTVYENALLEKTLNYGCMELRTALKDYLARNRGIFVDVGQIVIGAGAEYLYGLIVNLFGREKKIAVEQPSYHKIEQVYQTCGISCEFLPLAEDGIDSAALAASKADILHTTPYRSYPSGVTASASKRHEYIRWAGEGDRFIIEDDFESEFSVSTKPMETLFSLSEYDNVIYLNTFSKTISPAIRAAYIVLPGKLTEMFKEKLGFYSCTVPAFVQFMIAELINSGEFERHINCVRRSKRKNLLKQTKKTVMNNGKDASES